MATFGCQIWQLWSENWIMKFWPKTKLSLPNNVMLSEKHSIVRCKKSPLDDAISPLTDSHLLTGASSFPPWLSAFAFKSRIAGFPTELYQVLGRLRSKRCWKKQSSEISQCRRIKEDEGEEACNLRHPQRLQSRERPMRLCGRYSHGRNFSISLSILASPWLPDSYSQIFRLYVFGPSGLKDYGSAYATRQNFPSGKLGRVHSRSILLPKERRTDTIPSARF